MGPQPDTAKSGTKVLGKARRRGRSTGLAVVAAVALGVTLLPAPARAQTDWSPPPIIDLHKLVNPLKVPTPSTIKPARRTTSVKGLLFPGVAQRIAGRKLVKPIPPVASTSQDATAYQKPTKRPPIFGPGDSPIAKIALKELLRLRPRILKPPPLPLTSRLAPGARPTPAGTANPAPMISPTIKPLPARTAATRSGPSPARSLSPPTPGGRPATTASARQATVYSGHRRLELASATGTAATPAPCDPAVKGKIYCENQLPGVAEADWDLPGANAGDPTLQGFATDISVNVGQTVSFKIKSTASNYRLDLYRLGYYGGAGARLVATVNPTVPYPQAQPACRGDTTTGLFDCGNWAVSATWAVPSTAVSGVYIARLVRLDNGGASHVPFIVRDDASHSAIMLKTSDATWEAYNAYGGNSLYLGSPAGRAYKVSYNRPYDTRVTEPNGWNWIFSAEFPMIRFMEANGYDVTYTTDVDTTRRGNLIKNHKTFVSSGHDEYWSAEQRDNVAAARDAGVNLAFFSGNEVYWKTRWEPSIAGPTTDYRTIVCYKETRNAGPLDPSYPGIWTGTWRDPTYSPPSTGGKPENSLTGTLYMVDPPTDFPLQITPQYSKLRFWRNTSIATATTTTTLSPATLGYEFDSDPDNGARPPGLFDISGQTENVQSKLLDYGATTGPGAVTHHITSYRAPSGALVFGAGTVQWAYGLDPVHDGVSSTADARMRQATVNLLADMGNQPTSPQPGLVAAAASSDHTAPTSAVTSTAHPVVGTKYTLTGTATDTGGVVSGVEVSTDGGNTYHPAAMPAVSKKATWSYQFLPSAPGPMSIKVRAVDDSANLASPATTALTVDRRICPCGIFSGQTPATPTINDTSDVELGVKFRATIDGSVTGVRFYKGGTTNAGPHTGSVWSSTGVKLATGTFGGESGSGWQTLTFGTPVAVTAGTTYIASYRAPAGHYAGDTNFFTGRSSYSAPLLAPESGADGPNGVYHVYGSGEFANRGPVFPTDSFRGANYWVDVVFSGDTSTDTSPPSVTKTVPLAGSASVPATSPVTASFSKPFEPSTVSFTLAAGSTPVPGVVSTNPDALTATLTPSSPLAPGTTFTATISAADSQGHTLTPPFTWAFTTATASTRDGTCPCTVWSEDQQPSTVSTPDADAIELGVKIRSSRDGFITGIRFYKGPQNTGVHTGSVWTTAGTRLATVTFSGESTAGWQQATVDPPVAVTANTTYVVSYHTNVGFYSSTVGYFAGGATYGPLTALADGVDGGDGVFAYGSGSTFPAGSSGATNYWVDAVFATSAPPPTAPRVVGVSPSDGWTGSALATKPRAVFDRPLEGASVVATLKAGSTTVAGAASYDPTSSTVTFTPAAPLAFGTTYTVSVQASGQGGVAMPTPKTWSFTTGTPATCPCTLWPASTTPANASADDAGSFELGTRFTSDVGGFVTGVRFYKGAGNVGTHTGSLWTLGGSRLATGTFTGETASGWQNLTFAEPVAISAGQTYVASYTAPSGHYSYDSGYFATDDADHAPLHAPSAGSGGLNGVYRSGGPGYPSTSYNATNYWVQPVVTTTATAPACPCTLFGAQAPAGGPSPDTDALELGVRFTADRAGQVTGVRFYKSTANTGVHTGSLWTSDGTRLATGTFTNETASGWQTLTFSSPVALTAGDTYVASYHTTAGGFYATASFFDAPYDAIPLHAPGTGQNGVFLYGSGGFPLSTYSNTSYWVDVVFSAS